VRRRVVARRAGSQFNGPTTPDEPGFNSDENDHGRSTAGLILALDLGEFKSIACAHDNASVEYSPATIATCRGLVVSVLVSSKQELTPQSPYPRPSAARRPPASCRRGRGQPSRAIPPEHPGKTSPDASGVSPARPTDEPVSPGPEACRPRRMGGGARTIPR